MSDASHPAADQPVSTPAEAAPSPVPEVPEWLTLPDAAESLGLDILAMRRLLENGDVLALKWGSPAVLRVPAAFVPATGLLTHLKGTLTTLADAGLDDREIISWLFRVHDSLGRPPIEALAEGRRAEIRTLARLEAI